MQKKNLKKMKIRNEKWKGTTKTRKEKLKSKN